MDGIAGPGEGGKRPARKRVRRDAPQSAKGAKMEGKVPTNLSLSARARMALDVHAKLYRGTPRGSISGLVEALIAEHLREVRISYHGEGAAGQGRPGGEGEREP